MWLAIHKNGRTFLSRWNSLYYCNVWNTLWNAKYEPSREGMGHVLHENFTTLETLRLKFYLKFTYFVNCIKVWPLAVDGIKIFDNDDQAAKHYCCLPLTLSSWQATVKFCGLVIIIKIFSINSRRPWPPILISHLFQHGLL